MTIKTKVVNKHEDSFFDVYIGRPSIWGNPFTVGRDGTRKEVVAKYEEWLKSKPELLARIPELKGKVLGCHCKPKLCHGDVLARLADEEELDPRLKTE